MSRRTADVYRHEQVSCEKGLRGGLRGRRLNRDVFINREPGFVVFHMLKGPQDDECSLYVSHTIWATRQDFENWTRSESFRAAHKSAGGKKPLYLGGPHFEGFDAIQEVKPAGAE